MSIGPRRHRSSVTLGKRVGTRSTSNPPVRKVLVLGQAFRRVQLRVKIFGSAKYVRPIKSTVVNQQHKPYPIRTLETVELVRARIKRLTAKSRLGNISGRPTTRPKIQAVTVLAQAKTRQSAAKRIATHTKLFRPFGGFIAPPPPVTVRRMPFIQVYQ